MNHCRDVVEERESSFTHCFLFLSNLGNTGDESKSQVGF